MYLKILTILFIAITFRVIYNLYYFLLSKQYYKKYRNYIKNPKDWYIREHRQAITTLFEKAGIEETYLPNVEPAGYGMLSTGNFSVFKNLWVLREDVVTLVNGDFRESIAVYKSRMADAINPFYWMETFIQLPSKTLKYLGFKPQSAIVKLIQLIWWFLVAVSTIVGTVFNSEFIIWLYKTGILRK